MATVWKGVEVVALLHLGCSEVVVAAALAGVKQSEM